MDVVASSSSVKVSPLKKRKRLDLGALALSEKQCVINMYKQMLSGKTKVKMCEIVSKIMNALGIARSTVFRTIREYRKTGNIRTPKKRGGRPGIITRFDEIVKNSVRQIIHSFFYKNEMPTLNKILHEINSLPDLQKFSRSSLYKFMKKINFKYVRRNRRSILIERHDIIIWRRNYLTSIKKYRKENRHIYYLDETWVNEGHTKEKIWVDESVKNRRQAFIEGVSTGLKNPSGKGKRLIIVHVGSELGFVDGGLLVFKGIKTTDYHEEMNAKVFEEWFQKILQLLPDNAVIVMDNASYHSRKVEKIPTTSSKKKDMQDWLSSKNIDFDVHMVRSELLQLINLHKERYNFYVTDEMAKRNNRVVLRLPPYHCELNPIELIWAQIKNKVASENRTFKLKEVNELLLQAIKDVKSSHWKICVEHIIKEEEKMCKLDGIMDTIIEPLIISIGAESDTSSESSDTETELVLQ